MPAYYYVYVPRESRENLDIGIASSVWGWRSSALGRRISETDPRPLRHVARSMRPGDHLVLGHWGPDPRVKPGGYADAVLRQVVFTRVVGRLYESAERVWPDKDEIYPERIRLAVLDVEEGVSGQKLGAGPMEALRLSANKGGVPMPGAPFALEALAADESTDVPDDTLDHEGDVDAVATVLRRKEQRKLRRKKFGERPRITCDLCGRELPQRLVVAAHIKRRADASYAERLNPHNVMAACLLGCDALFEHGYVYVDAAGHVRASKAEEEATAGAVAALVGRRCTAFGSASRDFFAAHAARASHTRAARIDVAWPADLRVEAPPLGDHVGDGSAEVRGV